MNEHWHTDADGISPSNIEKIIMKNDIVKQFLSNDNKHFIVASKGIGKTLLLKYKRYLIDLNYKNIDGGTQLSFIPESTPYLDFVSDFGSVGKATRNTMEDLHISRKLWTVSIMVSALSYYYFNSRANVKRFHTELEELTTKTNQKYKTYIEWFSGIRKVSPCYILRNLLNLSKSELLKFIDLFYPIIEEMFKTVQSGVIVFIDRVDQAIKMYGKDVWINFQAGLIEAAWDIMRINNHVKIYTSIRQEAWSSYSSSDKEAIKGSVSLMRYSHNELLKISNHNCKYYEKKNSLEELIGFKEVLNTFCNVKESIFKYIQRHTIGRPRDLVAIFSSLSPYCKELTEEKFKEVVNATSHIDIGKNLFEELIFLFHSINSLEKQEEFLSLIPQNILSQNMINEICRSFNGNANCNGGKDCKTCQGEHIFCDLYSAGFLGVIKLEKIQGNSNGEKKQKFLGPYNLRSYEKGGLPSTDGYYLIHPCLQEYIEEVRNRKKGESYKLVNHILVGHNYEWKDKFSYLVELDFAIDNVKDADFKIELNKLLNDILISKDQGNENFIEKSLVKISNVIEKSGSYSNNINRILSLIEKVTGLIPN